MKKVWQIIKYILVALVVIFAVCMMIFTIVSITTSKNKNRSFFGYKAFIVLTDSMSATDFKSGDLVIVRDVDPSTLKVGDVISYRSTNIEHYYEVVTHKIRKKVRTDNGNPGFITYGTTTNTNDQEIVTYENVLGKHCKTLAGVGTFFQFLKTVPGYIICILIPFLILILSQVINCIRLFRRYQKEQHEEMEAERKKLEAEREENMRMREELYKETMKIREIQEELNSLRENLMAGNKHSHNEVIRRRND